MSWVPSPVRGWPVALASVATMLMGEAGEGSAIARGPLWRSSAGCGRAPGITSGSLRGRHDLRDARETRGARSREADHGVHRAVRGRGDAEGHALPRRVRRAVGQIAGGHAGLDDTLRAISPIARRTAVEVARGAVVAVEVAVAGAARDGARAADAAARVHPPRAVCVGEAWAERDGAAAVCVAEAAFAREGAAVLSYAEGAGGDLARAEAPARAGLARGAGGEGVQGHGDRPVEEPAALIGRAVLARVAGGDDPGGGDRGARSALVRSVGAARRTGAAAGRGAAVALRAGRAVVGGDVDAGLEREVDGGVSGRGIARPARVARDDVDVAAREGGDRRVRDRERRAEEAVRERLAAASDTAAIRVRGAAHVRVRPGTGAAAQAVRGGETVAPGVRAADAGPRVHTFERRARPLGAVGTVARGGPDGAVAVAGDEIARGPRPRAICGAQAAAARVGAAHTAVVDEGGGSGRGG